MQIMVDSLAGTLMQRAMTVTVFLWKAACCQSRYFAAVTVDVVSFR